MRCVVPDGLMIYLYLQDLARVSRFLRPVAVKACPTNVTYGPNGFV